MGNRQNPPGSYRPAKSTNSSPAVAETVEIAAVEAIENAHATATPRRESATSITFKPIGAPPGTGKIDETRPVKLKVMIDHDDLLIDILDDDTTVSPIPPQS